MKYCTHLFIESSIRLFLVVKRAKIMKQKWKYENEIWDDDDNFVWGKAKWNEMLGRL